MTELPLVVRMTVDSSQTDYDLSVESNTQNIELENETVIETGGSHIPVYEGDYVVDRGLSPVVLETNGKRMTDDVTVNALTDNYISGNNITVDSNGRVSSFVSVSAGYSPNVFAQMFYKQLDTQARATITPSTSEQIAVARGKYTTGVVKVRAISSPYADVSGVTANASDVMSGKYFVDSNGVLTLGTGTGGGGMDTETKDALLECFEHVAWIDENGQTYYDNLFNALYPLQSISAVYTQSGTVTPSTPLDDLKSDLVVTATFGDGTTKTVTNYALSGTLTVGTSTVTVTYFTETTTFNVTVTQRAHYTGYVEVGTPTISNNILTVADGKFIKSNQAFSPNSSTWAVRCKARRTAQLGSYADLFGSVDSNNASARGFLVEFSNGTASAGSMFASSNGTSWDITSSDVTNSLPTDTNTWIWYEMSFDGSSYNLKYSTDGSTWTTKKTKNSTTSIIGGYAVGFGLKRNGVYRGDIDLSGCEIYIDGQLWWSAI